jgi:hypothetical protein
MAMHRVIFEHEVEADSPEDAATMVRDMLQTRHIASIFIVDVAGGKVIVDTDEGNETVIRDDRKRIGPVFMRLEGPTGVVTSPVMAEFYGHDKVTSRTDLELVDGKWLLLRGVGPEAYYEMINQDGSFSEPFAVITVHRIFSPRADDPTTAHGPGLFAASTQH